MMRPRLMMLLRSAPSSSPSLLLQVGEAPGAWTTKILRRPVSRLNRRRGPWRGGKAPAPSD
eukprot:12754570-Prorocentrum_lima.AAC.1